MGMLARREPQPSSKVMIFGSQLIGGQGVQEIFGGPEILDQDFMLIAACHADLEDVEVGGLVRGEEDVVVGSVLVLLEKIGGQVAAQMVIPAGGEVTGAEDFFVLNIGVADRENLGAEAKLAEDARHGVIG